jgi:hypothetical protein
LQYFARIGRMLFGHGTERCQSRGTWLQRQTPGAYRPAGQHRLHLEPRALAVGS